MRMPNRPRSPAFLKISRGKIPSSSHSSECGAISFRQNCLTEIAPHSEEWDEEGIFPREIFKKAGDLGLFGIRIDPKWGGSGLDWWATAAYLEGLSYANNGGVGMALMVQSDITLPA